MRLIQVTMTGSKQQVTTGQIYSPFVTFQNNGSNAMRIGDNTVSATKGINLSASGAFTVQRADNRVPLFSYFVIGTSGDKLDILYE